MDNSTATTIRGISLQYKFMLAMTALVTLVMGSAGMYWLYIQQQIVSEELETRATQTANLLGKTLATPLWNIDLKYIQEQLDAVMADDQVVYAALVGSGHERPLAEINRQDGETVDGIERIAPVVYIKDKPSSRVYLGHLRLIYSRKNMNEALGRTQKLILGTVLFLVGSVCAATYLLSRLMVQKPIGELLKVTRRIAEGDFDAAIPVSSRDEIGTLGENFNFMTNKLKQTMEVLRKSEEKYRGIFENALEGIFQASLKGELISVNPSMARILAYDSPEEMVRAVVENGKDWIDPTEREQFISALMERGTVLDYEARLYSKTGDVVWVAGGARVVCDAAGNALCCEGFVTDITERIRTREELQRSEEKYRTILENIEDAYVETDPAGNLVFFNPFICRMLEYTADEIRGINFRNLMTQDTAQEIKEIFSKIYTTGKTVNFYECRLIRKDGTEVILETSVSLIKNDKGEPIGFRGIGRDITKRKRAEQELLKERERLAAVLDGNPIPAAMIDHDHKIVFWNRALETLTSIPRENALGRPLDNPRIKEFLGSPIPAGAILDMNDHDLLIRYGNSIRKAKYGEAFETTIKVSLRGETRILDIVATRIRDHTGKVMGVIQCAQDVTDKIRMQNQLQRSNKMEAIGTLAGGIAHDFNNILTAIAGFAEMALTKVPIDSPIHKDLIRVLESGARAGELVRQILSFSRQPDQKRKPVQVSEVVKEVLSLLRPSLPATIEIRQQVEIPKDEDIVLTDSTQIHQVLMNLCTNAAHAMRAKGGTLDVSITGIFIGSDLISGNPELKPGPYVCLTVSDTGHGMDHATIDRIFDPYFTTKKIGEGTGLGLAVVQGIVKNCGGAITVQSEPGQGACFNIFLPQIQERLAYVDEKTPETLPTGDETILFVDDESLLVDLAKEMLETLGYTVKAVSSSMEALAVFKEQPYGFDLVITDLTMPGLTGLELADQIMAVRPEMPIIICTGFSEQIQGGVFEQKGIKGLVMKPYAITSIAKTIRSALA